MKKLVSFLLIAAMALGLCACGTTEAVQETVNRDEALPAVEPIQIVFLAGTVGEWSDEAVASQLMDKFNDAFPGIEVSVQYMTEESNDMAETVKTGKIPDLVLAEPEDLAFWNREGILTDLADLWTEDTLADTYDSAASACRTVEGVYYGYPLCINVYCMALNKSMLKDAKALDFLDQGSRVWTTSSFLQTCEALYEDGQRHVAVIPCGGIGGDEGSRALITNLYGGAFTNPEHTRYMGRTDENIRALSTLRKLDGVEFDPDTDGIAQAELFAQGKIPMTFYWDAAAHRRLSDTIGDNFEVIPMAIPSMAGLDTSLCSDVWAFGVFDNGDPARIEAAKTFIRFMAEENVTEAVRACGLWSVRKSCEEIYADDEIRSLYGVMIPYAGDYADVTPGFEDAREAWCKMLQSVEKGTSSKRALSTFADAANASAG